MALGARSGAEGHGRRAHTPLGLPARGWKDVLVRVKAEAKDDQLVFLAGGVAFFALIAVVPAMVALVSLFGLVAEPGEVQRQVADNLAAAPREVRQLVVDQLEGVTTASSTGLGLGLVAGFALAVWSASSGMKNLLAAINAVYDERESRSFVPSAAGPRAFPGRTRGTGGTDGDAGPDHRPRAGPQSAGRRVGPGRQLN